MFAAQLPVRTPPPPPPHSPSGVHHPRIPLTPNRTAGNRVHDDADLCDTDGSAASIEGHHMNDPSPRMQTKPIPSSGEPLGVIGLGTYGVST